MKKYLLIAAAGIMTTAAVTATVFTTHHPKAPAVKTVKTTKHTSHCWWHECH